MNNKTSIFVTYALITVVGFAGMTALALSGKAADSSALVSFLGFYGFLCTTGIFYVLGKQKAALEAINTHINEVNDSHWKNSDDINRRITENFSELQRESQKQMDTVWVNIDRLESDLEDCRTCTPCKK